MLITAGAAIAVSLVVRPPADTPAAARRLALMFALSPATRFGYFAYLLGLLGWVALCYRTTCDPLQKAELIEPAVGAVRWLVRSGGRLAGAVHWNGLTGQRGREGTPEDPIAQLGPVCHDP